MQIWSYALFLLRALNDQKIEQNDELSWTPSKNLFQIKKKHPCFNSERRKIYEAKKTFSTLELSQYRKNGITKRIYTAE